jgi:thiamine biosynthesis lipoprotein
MPRQFCHVASEALAIAKQTSGAFDPTIGPLVSKFGFGPIMGGMGSYTDISVREDAVQKTAPDLTLDLCGIAKGYALDQIVEALALAGIDNALVEVGGEVRTLGQHPTGRNWKVAISDPNSVLFRTSRVVDPGSYALATSGHSANGLLGAVSVSHLIDPHRGRPAPTTLASVSVLAPTALRADALATAICAVGLDAGVDLARRLNVAALFLPNDTVEQTETMTGEFSRHVLF